MKLPVVVKRWHSQCFIGDASSGARVLRFSISLALSLIFLGSALVAYQVSFWGWIGTIVSLQYLSKKGRGAIPLALAWATGILWVAAFYYSTPVGFLWRNPRYWAASLMFLWIFATAVILTVAKIPALFQVNGKMRHATWLVSSILMNGCLGLGACFYRFGLALQ